MAIQRRPADKVGSGARYVVLVLGAVLFLVPFYLLLRNGLSTESDITSPDWTLFPSSLQWGNIAELFDSRSVPMARSLANSAVIAVTQTALVQRRALRDGGHAVDTGGGDVRAELRARLHSRLGQQPARPHRPRPVPGV